MAIRWKCVNYNNESWLSVSLPKKYRLKYKKGTKIKAPKNSLGIFTFETKKMAERFLRDTESEYRAKIKKVRGIGKGKRVKSLLTPRSDILKFLVSSDLKNLLEIYSQRFIWVGGINYSEVEVLS